MRNKWLICSLKSFCAFFGLMVFFALSAAAQSSRTLSGVVVTTQFELVPNVTIEVETPSEKITAVTDAEGAFSLQVPSGPISVKVSGRNLVPLDLNFTASGRIENVQWKITYLIPPITESVTIDNDVLAPDIERRDDTIYKNSLFARDDQLVFTLNAGINAGQHEGGGKSLEIRRFGFNTDHGWRKRRPEDFGR